MFWSDLRFVSLVKAKTPKVILYSSQAKCLLMENGPNGDFEAIFYSGLKMVRTLNNLVLSEPNGRITNITITNNEPLLDREATREMWSHLKECLVHCQQIEATIEQLKNLPLNGSLPYFPITIGRRPPAQSSVANKLCLNNKENQMIEPVLSGLKSFDGSVRSSINSSYKTSSVRRFDQQQQVNVSRTVIVPGIGRALQKSSGKAPLYH